MQVGRNGIVSVTLVGFVGSGKEQCSGLGLFFCGRRWCCHLDRWFQRKVQGPLGHSWELLSSPPAHMEPTSHLAPGVSRTWGICWGPRASCTRRPLWVGRPPRRRHRTWQCAHAGGWSAARPRGGSPCVHCRWHPSASEDRGREEKSTQLRLRVWEGSCQEVIILGGLRFLDGKDIHPMYHTLRYQKIENKKKMFVWRTEEKLLLDMQSFTVYEEFA